MVMFGGFVKMDKIKAPWGYEGTIVSNDLYASRILIIKEGEQTPYVYYKKQDKTFYVLQGVINLVLESRNKMLNEGDR